MPKARAVGHGGVVSRSAVAWISAVSSGSRPGENSSGRSTAMVSGTPAGIRSPAVRVVPPFAVDMPWTIFPASDRLFRLKLCCLLCSPRRAASRTREPLRAGFAALIKADPGSVGLEHAHEIDKLLAARLACRRSALVRRQTRRVPSAAFRGPYYGRTRQSYRGPAGLDHRPFAVSIPAARGVGL